MIDFWQDLYDVSLSESSVLSKESPTFHGFNLYLIQEMAQVKGFFPVHIQTPPTPNNNNIAVYFGNVNKSTQTLLSSFEHCVILKDANFMIYSIQKMKII